LFALFNFYYIIEARTKENFHKKFFMIPESNFSNTTLPNKKPKKGLILAILLGLLNIIITPVIVFLTLSLSEFLSEISEIFHPTVIIALIIAVIFGLKGLDALIPAHIILMVLLGIIGAFITAKISWFINRSKKLAFITFVSAFIFAFIFYIIYYLYFIFTIIRGNR
jgi:hypothetical protein